MRHAKKLASLLLALVMVLALTTTAFAEETGTITVDNPVASTTYTAYKIFDVVYDETGTHYSYTIASDSEWLTTVQGYHGVALSNLVTDADGKEFYVVTMTENFSAPEFAVVLKSVVAGKLGTLLVAQADGTASVSGLPLGYYFVTSSTGALCNLTTTNPAVTIHDKNDVPFEKVDDQESVDVGTTVNYTITGKVPDYTGFTSYTYLITDTMSEGLTFQKSVKVTVGGTDVTSSCTPAYDVDGNANKFTVSIPIMNYTIGAAIQVTYSAVVNEKAVAKVENNAATLTYSNDPTDSTKTTTTPEDIETVYSAKIVIDKYETGKENTKLAGATFVLYKEATAEGATQAAKLYYKWNDTEKKVEWVPDRANATSKVTDTNGAASFDGLADGTYYLEETKAPAGYNLLDASVPVTVNGANATAADTSSLTITEKVANSTGSLLPATGGMGTTIFYVLGFILVLGAAVLLVTKKRMSTKG